MFIVNVEICKGNTSKKYEKYKFRLKKLSYVFVLFKYSYELIEMIFDEASVISHIYAIFHITCSRTRRSYQFNTKMKQTCNYTHNYLSGEKMKTN